MGKCSRSNAAIVHDPAAACSPQGGLLIKLIPVTDWLSRRGAVCQSIEQWSEDDGVVFTITAVFGSDTAALDVGGARLVNILTRQGFEVRQSFSTDIGERDIHVTAAMKVQRHRRQRAA